MTKPLLLLALLLCGIAGTLGRPSGRQLLQRVTGCVTPTSEFTCRDGTAYQGNNRGSRCALTLSCATGDVECRSDDCPSSEACMVTCTGGIVLEATTASDGMVTFSEGGEDVTDSVQKAFVKGCEAFCLDTDSDRYFYTPKRTSGQQCGLSHVDLCYTPCTCDISATTGFPEAPPAITVCPGAPVPSLGALPEVKDNCGKVLTPAIVDPSTTTCGVEYRTITYSCNGQSKVIRQEVVVEDGDVTVACDANTCPLRGTSTCGTTTEVSFVGGEYTSDTCALRGTFKAANKCGVDSTTVLTVSVCG